MPDDSASTLDNILLSEALVLAMEPYYLSWALLLSEWGWKTCVCLLLASLITLDDKCSDDNRGDNSIRDSSKWLRWATCGVGDGTKTIVGVVSVFELLEKHSKPLSCQCLGCVARFSGLDSYARLYATLQTELHHRCWSLLTMTHLRKSLKSA